MWTDTLISALKKMEQCGRVSIDWGAQRVKLIERHCDKCGSVTKHICGMACVEMCPECDRNRMQ